MRPRIRVLSRLVSFWNSLVHKTRLPCYSSETRQVSHNASCASLLPEYCSR